MKRYFGVRPVIKGELYEVNFRPYPKAERSWQRVRAKGKREAYEAKMRLIEKHKLNEGVMVVGFSQLRERLELKLKADNLNPKTIKNLLWKFRNFFEEYLPKAYPQIINVNQITKGAIENYKQEVVVVKGRATGWRDELTKLKVIIKKLVEIGYCNKEISDDVLKKFKRPKRTKKLYREIPKSDMKKLLDYIKKDRPDYYGITYMVMRLGWRRGQVISIKKRNVRTVGLRPIEILIEAEDTKTKEPFAFRDIDDELANILRQYKFKRRKSEWLFPNGRGGRHHPNHYTEYMRKTSQEVLGMTIGPHYFRHSFITRMLREGHAPRDIMAITGHKDINSFNIYAHSTSEGTRKVVAESKLWV